MTSSRITRRQFVAASASGLAATALGSVSASAQNFGSAELIEAAKKEGKLVYYTANFTEVEQEIIKAFNKRFPFVKIEMVRAPGGQLITRIKTEAAAGKLLGRRRQPFRPRSDAATCRTCSRTTRRRTPPTTAPTCWSRRSSGRGPRSAGRSPTTPS